MMGFAQVKQARDQLVLFPERLDQVVDHEVRLVDKILQSVDFSEWEARYDLSKGPPPIHPRIMAGVILYGLLCHHFQPCARDSATMSFAQGYLKLGDSPI